MKAPRLLIALAIVVLPGVMLAPVWHLSGLGAGEDDVLYYYPSRVFFHETIGAGQWPWLNPWNGLDRPYAADPQSALWYPFTWLFALLPPLAAYPVSLWAHYCLAMWGTYRLLRGNGLRRLAALFGGLAFAFCGFMLAHRAHFAMQHAAAWAPWVFWRMQRYAWGSAGARGAQSAGQVLRLGAAAAVTALQCFSGHVQMAALSAAGTLVFLLARGRSQGDEAAAISRPGKRVIVARWLIVWVCVAGLFAIQWLPTLAYVRLCTRVERTYSDFVENSWYPSSALGWVLPMFFGQRTENVFSQSYWGPSHQCEQFGYAGLVPLLLAALALRTGWRWQLRRRPWTILLIFSLLLALGCFGPLCPLLYWIPGSSLFRVPARALLLFNLAVAALAAVALNDVAAAHTPRRVRLRATAQRWFRRPVLKALLLVGIPLGLVALTLLLLPGEVRRAALLALRPWSSAVLIPLGLAVLSVIAVGLAARRWRQPRWLWLPVAVTALDLGVIGWTIDVPTEVRGPGELLAGPERSWIERVRASGERLWVVTDTAGVYTDPVKKCVANTNALVHVSALTDYGPLQPRVLATRFGFTPWGVSTRAGELLRETEWMRTFNVGWILLCEAETPEPAGCDFVGTTPEGWRLYHNAVAAGLAFFADAAQPGAVRYGARSAHEFVTTVDAWPTAGSDVPAPPDHSSWPGLLVSRLALPGWRATSNGQRVAIECVDNTILAVRVPPNRAGEIEWSYFPPGLREGALVSALSAGSLLLLITWAHCRRRTAARAEARGSLSW